MEVQEEKQITRKQVVMAKLLIPAAWLVVSILFEVIMFTRTGWGMPAGFFFSFAVMLVFALIISCIPNRTAQISIFGFALFLQGGVTLANIGATSNLSEIFQFENVMAFTEIWFAMESAQLVIFLELGLLIALGASFIAACIIVKRKLRHIRAGYTLKGFVVVILIMTITLSGKIVHHSVLPPVYANWIDNEHNSRFMLNQFSHRENYLRRFGSFAFYFRNLLHITGINPTFTTELPPTEFSHSDWVELSPEWQLDENYNMIMLMMETVELDAIHPVLTPNLYRIQGMSTWVDGFYGHERTNITEYVSLVGSHVQGLEMWSNFPRVKTPQSLPHIFRRAGHDQIGAIHNFHRTFYGRSSFFLPQYKGFDWIKDTTHVGIRIHNSMSRNSDSVMFREMINYIAPSNRTFFNYVLNISPHAPHTSSVVMTLPDFAQATQWIQDHENILIQDFPKMGLPEIRHAVMSYMIALHDYDIGIGILMEHLENTPDLARHPCGTVMLADTTVLVLYGDHFNMVAYNDPRNPGGGLLSGLDAENNVLGERLPFMILNPNDRTERRIERFMANIDIYATITHMFGIRTYNRLTLGVSVLDPTTVSLGVGFVTSTYTGVCMTSGRHFLTRDFRTFYDRMELNGTRWRTVEGDPPCDLTTKILRDRANTIIGAMFQMRYLYRQNALRNMPEAFYVIGSARV
ncbi:MAG: sulfatase-like hydrolase/transferase [Firmicutes bacterium]|nr:sulfatase-like hydrolase/transferase [Bacillota bacterium]